MTSTASATPWAALSDDLTRILHLQVPPLSISFVAAADELPDDVPAFDAPLSEPTPDGRQGRVPAGCVFWVHGVQRAFTTAPADHGNCSVGRYTHGFASLEEVATKADVAALLESGWVSTEAVSTIPHVTARAERVLYAPLATTPVDPDVVLLRVNGRQLMVLSDAMPAMRIEGKPQCHIVAVAKERGEVAASVGCALSRARTGMHPDEMTCAIPGSRVAEVVDAVERAADIDTAVAKYAAEDARRFAP